MVLGLMGRDNDNLVAGTGQLLQASRGQAGSCRLTRSRPIVAGPGGDRHLQAMFAGNRLWCFVGVTADSNAQHATLQEMKATSSLLKKIAASKQLTRSHLAWDVQDACTAMSVFV